VPGEVLARRLLKGERRHCIKDLVFHIAVVEDAWINIDIQGKEPLLLGSPELKDSQGGPEYAGFALEILLNYWRAVEQNTLAYLSNLNQAELKRVAILQDSPIEQSTVDKLLWHVVIHEIRHTAQIAVLLRTQGIKPPSLDLLFYLPSA
jgi:uncharacterized damage-inducible protein DinB